MGKLALAASNLDNLFDAWRDVRRQVQRSSWPQIAAELGEIEAAPLRALRAIQKQLRLHRYTFSPKWGYAKRKSGGSRRGITVHRVRDRIVQRSILNVISTRDRALQNHLGDLPRILNTPTSFAGSPGRGVPEAIALAVTLIRGGASAFALSDIKDFFPRVPRGEVIQFLKDNVHDDEFVELFQAALETEIQNRDELAEWLELFPTAEVGVAQGSLLSVLVGNLSLRQFDARLNDGRLTTIRYLDDFAIFGPSLEAVAAGFHAAQDELAKLGMTCYEPTDGSQKAFIGRVTDGFEFLGCRIHPDGVSPGRQARRKLLREIALTIAEAKRQIRRIGKTAARRRTERVYAQTLVHIDKKVRGWGDAYRFVSNRLAFSQIDDEIDRILDDLQRWFSRQYHGADARTRRRTLGVALLSDTPPRPLDLR
jgi:RNA-directed DNA polymerase